MILNKYSAVLIALVGRGYALDRVTSVVGGVAEYTGVPVDVYNPLPTLIYNCDNLPAICENVNEFLLDNPNTAPWNGGLEFHYDSDGTSSSQRGRQSCPSNWQRQLVQNNVVKPCGSYFGQPAVVPGNLLPRVGPIGNWIPKFLSEIPDATGIAPSGMRYTCEEFPARSWIEGGVDGNAPYTSVYCAPKSVSCSGTQWNKVKAANPNYPNTRSEQDWQANAHALVGGYARRRGGGTPVIMKFHFTTTNLGAAGAATAAQVVMPAFPNNPLNTAVAGTKKRTVNGEEGWNRLHCTGAFCDELKHRHGFDFEAPPPQASFQLFEANRTGPQSPHATFHVLVD